MQWNDSLLLSSPATIFVFLMKLLRNFGIIPSVCCDTGDSFKKYKINIYKFHHIHHIIHTIFQSALGCICLQSLYLVLCLKIFLNMRNILIGKPGFMDAFLFQWYDSIYSFFSYLFSFLILSLYIYIYIPGAGHLLQPWLPLGGGQHAAWHFTRLPHKPIWRCTVCPHTPVPSRSESREPLSKERRPRGDRAGAEQQAGWPLQPHRRPLQQPVRLASTRSAHTHTLYIYCLSNTPAQHTPFTQLISLFNSYIQTNIFLYIL